MTLHITTQPTNTASEPVQQLRGIDLALAGRSCKRVTVAVVSPSPSAYVCGLVLGHPCSTLSSVGVFKLRCEVR